MNSTHPTTKGFTQPHFVAAQKSAAGFTLVEMLVAITILLISVISPLGIMIKAMGTAITAREELIAVYLAEEGIEVAHYLRDNAALAYIDAGAGPTDSAWGWAEPINVFVHTNCFDPDRGCAVDIQSPKFKPCSEAVGCKLYEKNGQYVHDSSDAALTLYTRKVYMKNGTDNVEIRVEVTWDSQIFGGGHTLKVQSYIYNQYELPTTP
jgi:prepilin-type N-terminal cleavage/methylation domain-containing protein